MRVRYFIHRGDRVEQTDAMPEGSGGLALTVETNVGLDFYVVLGEAGESVELPFAIRVTDAGVLQIALTNEGLTGNLGHVAKAYSPSGWREFTGPAVRDLF